MIIVHLSYSSSFTEATLNFLALLIKDNTTPQKACRMKNETSRFNNKGVRTMRLEDKNKWNFRTAKAKEIENKSNIFFNNIDLFLMLLAILSLLIFPLMLSQFPQDLEFMDLFDQMEMLLWNSKIP